MTIPWFVTTGYIIFSVSLIIFLEKTLKTLTRITVWIQLKVEIRKYRLIIFRESLWLEILSNNLTDFLRSSTRHVEFSFKILDRCVNKGTFWKLLIFIHIHFVILKFKIMSNNSVCKSNTCFVTFWRRKQSPILWIMHCKYVQWNYSGSAFKKL